MLTYCVKCRQNTENLESKTVKTKNNRSILCDQNVLYAVVKSQDL